MQPQPSYFKNVELMMDHSEIFTTIVSIYMFSNIGQDDIHLLQVLVYSVVCVGVAAFSGSLIDAAKAEELMNTVRALTEESQQVSRRGGGTPGESVSTAVVINTVKPSWCHRRVHFVSRPQVSPWL